MDGTPEGRLLRCGVVEGSNHLEITAMSEGKNEVAGPEGRMQAAVTEGCPEIGTDALYDISELAGTAGVRHVVQPHSLILPRRVEGADLTPRFQGRFALEYVRSSGGSVDPTTESDPQDRSEVTSDPSAASDAPAASGAAPVALDKKKSIILGIVGLVFIVLIFWKVIPTIGSYSDAWESLQNMGWGAVLVIVLAVVVYLGVYGFTFMVAVPKLRFWQGQQINQAAFAISNGVPGGGAVGLAVQYGMLASYKVTPAASTAAITAVGLWGTFITLGFPILGVLALIAGGGGGASYLTLALIGLAILTAAVVLLVFIIRSEPLARRIGGWGNAILRPLGRRFKKLADIDLVPAIVNFRESIHDIVARRWLLLTLAQGGIFVTQFLILYMALRGVEGWDQSGTPLLIAFGAFAISQIGLMIPITPGGVGTVDAFMIAILTNNGTAEGAATAADLVWRASSFVPQIIIGVLALVLWYRRAGRTFAAASKDSEPEK